MIEMLASLTIIILTVSNYLALKEIFRLKKDLRNK